VLGELLQILKLLRLRVFRGGSLQIRDTWEDHQEDSQVVEDPLEEDSQAVEDPQEEDHQHLFLFPQHQ
jgi:hypothetical protein